MKTLLSLTLATSLTAFSTFTLAASYEEGREAYLAKDYAKALEILEPLAEKGHAKAQINMGLIYDFGHGVEKNTAEAIEWYEKAAAQGNSVVQHDLGVKYFRGDGIPQDYDKAGAWWRMAADNGVAESQYNLGLMYQRGLGFEKNEGQAINWFSKAAAQGHAYAQYSLGVAYSFGQGIPQDYTKSLNYFRDAAEQDISQAQYNLAVLLENGRGTEVDLAGAKNWYKKAADAGVDQAKERYDALSAAEDVAVKPVAASTPATQTEPVEEKTTEQASSAPAQETVAAKTEPLPEYKADVKPPENHTVVSGDKFKQPEQTNAPAAEPKPTPVVQQPAPTPEVPANTYTASTAPIGSDSADFVDWIQTQPPGHYALQMVAFREEENAVRFMQNLDLDGDKAVYKSTMHGRTIYKVVYGNFENHRESLRGRRALPKKYKDLKPFPRSFEFIQNDMQP